MMRVIESEPLDNPRAKALVRKIVTGGTYTLCDHVRKRFVKYGLNDQDCVNVLRAGYVEKSEWENGAWRYHVRTERIVFVVEFESEEELVVVTGWRV